MRCAWRLETGEQGQGRRRRNSYNMLLNHRLAENPQPATCCLEPGGGGGGLNENENK